MSALGHSRPSHFVPVLNNVRYASDSDHSRYEFRIDAMGQSRPKLLDANKFGCPSAFNHTLIGLIQIWAPIYET
jgi:hypothetical protein